MYIVFKAIKLNDLYASVIHSSIILKKPSNKNFFLVKKNRKKILQDSDLSISDPLSSFLSPYMKFLYSLYYNIILCFTKTITFLSLGKYY